MILPILLAVHRDKVAFLELDRNQNVCRFRRASERERQPLQRAREQAPDLSVACWRDMMGTMPDETFDVLDRYLQAGDRAGGLEYLIEHFRQTTNLHLFFEAELMKKRLELGLP